MLKTLLPHLRPKNPTHWGGLTLLITKQYKSTSSSLPPLDNDTFITVALDLDECLVHSRTPSYVPAHKSDEYLNYPDTMLISKLSALPMQELALETMKKMSLHTVKDLRGLSWNDWKSLESHMNSVLLQSSRTYREKLGVRAEKEPPYTDGIFNYTQNDIFSFAPAPVPATPDFQLLLEQAEYYSYWRPHLDSFLLELSKLPVEAVLFTSSLQIYADPIVDALDKCKVIKHRKYRNDVKGNNGDKDVRVLERPVERLLLIDDQSYHLKNAPDNGIEIEGYYGNNPEDVELLRILEVIKSCVGKSDIRPVLIQEQSRWMAEQNTSPKRLKFTRTRSANVTAAGKDCSIM